MSKVILVDFGSSRIKASLVDKKSGDSIDYIDCISPSFNNENLEKDIFEFDAEKYWRALELTAGALLQKHSKYKIDELWICFEMHGFLLANTEGNPLTGYISWKDQRATYDTKENTQSTLDSLKNKLIDFPNKTGMYVKSGLPIVNLSSGILRNTIPGLNDYLKANKVRFLSLSDWLLLKGGVKDPTVNFTLAASTGLFDIIKKEWSLDLLKLAGINPNNFIFSSVSEDIFCPLGEILLNNNLIKVFGGIGDFQAAIYGANFPRQANAIINLGTGSQVAIYIQPEDHELSRNEIRPLIPNGYAKVITHIPCGRALNVIENFIDGLSHYGNGENIFWAIWASLLPNDILESRAISNLNLFEASWKRNLLEEGFGWIGLDDGFSSPKKVIAGIAKSWLYQYIEALKLLDPDVKCPEILLSGGVAQKTPFLIEALSKLEPRRIFKLASTVTGEETLDGLRKLSISKIRI
jgi:hypothetical protein